MYVKTQDGEVQTFPYDTGSFLRDNPNTSFPKPIPDETLAEYGVYPVTQTAKPEHDSITHIAKPSAPELIEGVWTQGWTVEPRPDAADRVRSERNRLLAQTDWTQVADAPVDQTAWATYRQVLRDVPQQAGFPADVTWPEEPQ